MQRTQHPALGTDTAAMHYPTSARAPGFKHDPFKALAVPRPIGWIATLDARVALAPAAFECRLWKTIDLPAPESQPGGPPPVGYTMVIGEVVAVYIDDQYIRDGMVDTGRMRTLARLGYMDYAVVGPESMFTLNRPLASADGQRAEVQPGPWDGVFR